MVQECHKISEGKLERFSCSAECCGNALDGQTCCGFFDQLNIFAAIPDSALQERKRSNNLTVEDVTNESQA
ncbi:DgyrCDS11050 [Dimorphilus gyrociliatus]|uniref:DgyrCDS11050 n=1 Tax=Dimorphilus gyrociliatus TaxID=2664684 RepID=A0A7I8W3I4_9ANNE|nr:DgyrCDS11050 [Dimorphilus gyrociliatus]